MKYRSSRKRERGFSLVETLVAVAVFALIAYSSYQAFAGLLTGIRVVRVKQAATDVGNQQIEIIRNMPYVDVGVANGIPDGLVPRTQTVERDGLSFTITTTIRNIDDPFDGQVGSTTNDTAPADYKFVEVEVDCGANCGVNPFTLSTNVAPKALETTGDNGALFVEVLSAVGTPVVDADVHIENNQGTSTINLDETTNNNGVLQLVDVPPGNEAYEITVTKTGYSTEKTYATGDPENPVPDKLHANVVTGGLTQISFVIDETSDLEVSSKTNTCSGVGNVDFQLTGSKTIGLNTLKYDEAHVTDSLGDKDVGAVEWDTYTIDVTDTSYDLAGSNTILPLVVNPASAYDVELIVEPTDPNAILFNVRDAATQLPISGATVTIDDGATTTEIITDRGFVKQTDWIGGSGQLNYTDTTRYFAQDGNIDDTTAGQLTLIQVAGEYVASGNLESSVIDTGTSTNFHALNWLSEAQPPEVGSESVRFQVASSLDNTGTTTWSYVGPDGTSGSYYTTPGETFYTGHNGDRYIRYKMFMQSASTTTSPTVSDVDISMSSECVPAGQAFFNGLATGEIDITITAAGYQNYTSLDYLVSVPWQQIDVIMSP